MSERLLREWIRESLISEAAIGGGTGGILKYRKRIEAFLTAVQVGKPFTLVADDGKSAGQAFIIPPDVSPLIEKDLSDILLAWDEMIGPGVKAWPKRVPLSQFPILQELLKRFSTNLKRAMTPLGPLSLSRIFKTKDLGGRENPEKCEAKQIGEINSAINSVNTGAGVSIKVGAGDEDVVHGIVSCQKVVGTPKADCSLNTVDGPVAWMSLKCADDGSQMNQWSGVSDFVNYPEVQEFTSQLTLMILGKPRLEGRYWKQIPAGSGLSYVATFGKKATPAGPRSADNVNMILATNSQISLSPLKGGGGYAFSPPSGFVMYNTGQVPSGGWTPILAARYTSGRGGKLGLTDVRVGVFPIAQSKWTGEVLPDNVGEDNPEILSPPEEVAPASHPTVRASGDLGARSVISPEAVNERVLREYIREVLLR